VRPWLHYREKRQVGAYVVRRERAGFALPIHVHMLRHACGYAPADAGHDTSRIQDWLGYRSIQHTTRYTQLSAMPFKDFWR
jgi:type 1 fimbriae regulatory protein FimB/type 1 fimbriae regulatory protein FimE